ncbi:MAG TPA: DUF167 domain-containing protein [Thiobacillaceae bacterium]|nr:DUF167 domain-containing protein [Thiobacillaceae bacterium]HNU65346.1 DUF167 domain-containing protein [Thiobacillaceae bacterium]
MTSYLRPVGQDTCITVHVQPGAAQCEVVGLYGYALKIRIAARAVEGAANAALLDFVARTLGVPRSGVRILRGEKSRRKVLAVRLPLDAVADRLGR